MEHELIPGYEDKKIFQFGNKAIFSFFNKQFYQTAIGFLTAILFSLCYKTRTSLQRSLITGTIFQSFIYAIVPDNDAIDACKTIDYTRFIFSVLVLR